MLAEARHCLAGLADVEHLPCAVREDVQMEQRWHWSALQTGLAVAPGPCMVPLFAVIGQHSSRKFPVGVITGVGALLHGLGAAVLLLSVGAGADYVIEDAGVVSGSTETGRRGMATKASSSATRRTASDASGTLDVGYGHRGCCS